MLLEPQVNQAVDLGMRPGIDHSVGTRATAGVGDPRPAAMLRLGLAAVDMTALGLAVGAGAAAAGHASPATVGFAVVALLALAVARPRPLPIRLSALKELPKVAVRLAMCSTLALPVAALLHDMNAAVTVSLLALVAVPVMRALAYARVRAWRRQGRLSERALIIARADVAGQLSSVMLDRRECGLVPVRPLVVDLTDGLPIPELPIVSVRGFAAELDASAAQHVILDPRASADFELSEISAITASRGVHLHILGGWAESMLVPAADCDDLWGFPLFSVRRPALVSWRLKRALDVSVAAALLVFLAPLLAAAALAVRLSSRGPVLFRQPRVGQHGRIINLLKFRTYPVDHVDREWSLNNDDCPLAIGRLLRRTSIDELPQLWNILRGDMSLVGPRPERPHFAEPLSARVQGYPERHRLPMGLTGLAQVNGLWGQTSIDDRVRFDNHYIDHWSLWGDIVIVLQTIPELLRRTLRS